MLVQWEDWWTIVGRITCVELRGVGHGQWKFALCIDRLANELRIEGRPRVDYEHRQGVTAGVDREKILDDEMVWLGSLSNVQAVDRDVRCRILRQSLAKRGRPIRPSDQ